MKSISLLASLAAVSVICISVGCSSKSDSGGNTAGTGTGGTSSGGDAANGGKGGKTSGGGGDTSSAGAGDTSSAGAGDSSAAGDGPGNGGPTATSCSTGVVVAGDPLWQDPQDLGADPKAAGQSITADPVPELNNPTFIGNQLYVDSQFEIWTADMSKSAPIISRLAGSKTDSQLLADTDCSKTRFIVTDGLAARPDGTLVTVDYVGNAVIEITDPGAATCKSHYVAGTNHQVDDPGTPNPVLVGDMDGPGAQAMFAGVEKVAIDPDSNIYTFDVNNDKIKMIANDKDRTVSTLTAMPTADDTVAGMAFLNGKLYVAGVDGSNDILLSIDPSKAFDPAHPKANAVEVFREPDHFQIGAQGVPSALVADGDALLLAGPSGYVWRVGTDGTVIATLAGSGRAIDFGSFDPTVAHPAGEWVLANGFAITDGPWLTVKGGNVYWSGGFGLGNYLVKFSCQ